MEILVTIAYLFLIRLVFFDFKWLKFNLVWGLLCSGLYASAALVEVVFLGQLTPYSDSAFVQRYVVQIGPQFGGTVTEVHVKQDDIVKLGDPLFSLEKDTFQATVDENQASLVLAKQNIKIMQAQLTSAGANVAHQESLLEQTSVQVEISKAAVSAAQARAKYDVDEAARQTKLAEEGAARKDLAERARQTAAVSSELVIEAEKQLKEDELIARDSSELDVAKAAYEEAKLSLDAMIDGEHASVRLAEAALAHSTAILKDRTVYAPSDGQVLNLQLQPGDVVRLKTPVLTFVNEADPWILMKIRQKGAQHITVGDIGEVAFEMYPGYVFAAEVTRIIYGNGNAQLQPSGVLPREQQVVPGETFFVAMRLTDQYPNFPLRFGAKGIAAIYTSDAADILKVLRKIELRSESYLNYVYNPFRG
ncbi:MULTISPECIES: HlyD family secretion protein [Falsihalocynthiibacter]|uniref:HlyD family secretion protein n=1 Tax=Falsihalocynthiibacter TaxID=2854182 RepID=UPI003003083B